MATRQPWRWSPALTLKCTCYTLYMKSKSAYNPISLCTCTIRVCSQCVQFLHPIKHTNGVFNGPGDFVIADISEKQKDTFQILNTLSMDCRCDDSSCREDTLSPLRPSVAATLSSETDNSRHRTSAVCYSSLPLLVWWGEINWLCLALGQFMGPLETQRGLVFTGWVMGFFVSLSSRLATSERTSALSSSPLPWKLPKCDPFLAAAQQLKQKSVWQIMSSQLPPLFSTLLTTQVSILSCELHSILKASVVVLIWFRTQLFSKHTNFLSGKG